MSGTALVPLQAPGSHVSTVRDQRGGPGKARRQRAAIKRHISRALPPGLARCAMFQAGAMFPPCHSQELFVALYEVYTPKAASLQVSLCRSARSRFLVGRMNCMRAPRLPTANAQTMGEQGTGLDSVAYRIH